MSQKFKRTEVRPKAVSSSKTEKTEKPKTPKTKKTSLSNGVNGTSKNSQHHCHHHHKTGDKGSSGGRSSSDEDEVTKMNLKTLQKVDARVSSILETVTHVVLYQYQTKENMWERTSSEGTFFVYRNSDPNGDLGFMILNKLSNNNIQETIQLGMEFRVQSPFVLYGRESGSIFGLCIQDKDRCTEIGAVLNRLSGVIDSSALTNGGGDHSEPGKSSASSPQGGHSGSKGAAETETVAQQKQQLKRALVFESPASREQPVPLRSKSSNDVMDMLEIAGQNYLGGQCFSDDTDSHDEMSRSPTMRGERGVVIGSSQTSECVSNSSHTPTSWKRKEHQQQHRPSSSSSSSHNLLLEYKPSADEQIQQPGSFSSIVPRDSSRSPLGAHRAHFPSGGGGGGGSSNSGGGSGGGGTTPTLLPRSKPMQRAVSFEHSRSVVSGRSVDAERSRHSGPRSNSLFETSPRTTTTTTQRQSYSAQVPSRAYSASANVSSSDNNTIVRKLFDTHAETSNEAKQFSVSLQTLFSQAGGGGGGGETSSSTSSHHGHAVSSSLSYASSVPTLSKQSHHPAMISALSLDEIEKQMTEEVPGSQDSRPLTYSGGVAPSDSKAVLLQPSAFSNITSAPSVISVDPPTPTAESASQAQVYPAIPPLMHSAGMTAPPLSQLTTPTKASSSDSASNKSQSTKGKLRPAQSSSHVTPKAAGAGGVIPPSEHASPAARELNTPSNRLHSSSSSSGGEVPVPPSRSLTAPASSSAALMSPLQFSKTCEEKDHAHHHHHQGEDVVGLSREQMQQAMLYLIQNDRTFVDTLYKAYQMSLSNKQI